MKKYLVIMLSLLMMPALIGCRQSVKQSTALMDARKAAMETNHPVIDDVNLAKIILKPVKKKLEVDRDPFKPLIEEKKKVFNAPQVQQPQSPIFSYQFMGTVTMNDEIAALLKGDQKRGIYKTNDIIRDYTIKKIQEDKVILSNGINVITLRRGVEK